MGTSQSSNGSPSNAPLIPPWVPDVPADKPQTPPDNDGVDNSPENDRPPPKLDKAPPARFGSARRNIGTYAKTGDSSYMRKGVGQYVKKGYGGASTAAKRMSGTAQSAGKLYSALSATSSGTSDTADSLGLDSASLAGKTAYEIMDIIVEAICPINGTQDAEASRDSIKDALSDVLELDPQADLNNLSDDQKDFAIERFVCGDVFRRIDLDLGKNIREKSASTSDACRKLKEIRNYVRETVAASFRKLKSEGQTLSQDKVETIVSKAIHETCEIFEGYAE